MHLVCSGDHISPAKMSVSLHYEVLDQTLAISPPLYPIRVAECFIMAPVMNRNCLSGKVLSWEQEFTGSPGAHWGGFNGKRESGTCSRQGQRPVLGMLWHWTEGGRVQSSTETYQPQIQGGDKGPEGPVEACVEPRPGGRPGVQVPTLADLRQDQPLCLLGSDSSSLPWAVT